MTTTLTRCTEGSCEANLECDEADGICKCGGSIGMACAAGDVCKLDPTPNCVSPICEFVDCQNGQTCNAETGACECGNEICEEHESCIEGVCTANDSCLETSCGEGLECDSSDGLCKCAGEICEGGAICIDGACTLDRCTGVSCGANSVCNPDDGGCHCGSATGAVCSTGEACLESEGTFGCAISTLCEQSSCDGGTVCDPEDGLCRCGGVGVGAPICGDGQSCVGGECRGGLLCAPDGKPVQCPLGLECDPTDGACKCGGKNGAFCGADEACTVLEGQYSCNKFCTLMAIPSGCPTGESCYYDANQTHGRSFCAPTGHLTLGAECLAPNECGPGLFCSLAEKCTQVCSVLDPPAVCKTAGSNLQCVSFTHGDTFGYCRAP